MTAPQKRTLLFTVTASVLGVFAWAILTAAARQVVLRGEYEMHVQHESSRIEEVRGIALDILCKDQPAHRRCR